MASRNLTDKFSEFRAARQRRPSAGSAGEAGGAGLLSADDGIAHQGSWQDVRNMLPPAWVDTVEEIEADMSEMDKKMDTLIGLHTKRLMVTFDDSSERDQDREIDAVAQSITALFRRCERTLKRIQGSSADSGSEQKIRGNLVRTLAQRLQGVNVKFRRAQKEYLSKRQAQKTGATADGTFDFLSETEKGTGAQLTSLDTAGVQFTMDQLAVVDDAEKLAAERDQEINKIVQNIEELSAIFKELAVLVIDQGTILDRIDYNMEQVVQSTEDGVVALEKAEKYQKSARPRWCICILLFLITILLTFLILKHNGTLNDPRDEKEESTTDSSIDTGNRLLTVLFPDIDGGKLDMD
mmetsp:Transcript_4455/g.9496  ORF Transcript_4455/g.9496 Transcript_4455/m.9496 type:complete len:352 (+) Transcript_4455:285-1340(+)